MIEKHIQRINLNPFFTGLIFQAFYNGFTKKSCPLILHYLVPPLVMFKDSRELFTSITKNAVLSSIIESNPVSFFELQERVWKMKKHTNRSLINLHNTNKITLKENVQILETVNYEDSNQSNKTYMRSAHYIGVLFKEFEMHEIYKAFKVIP